MLDTAGLSELIFFTTTLLALPLELKHRRDSTKHLPSVLVVLFPGFSGFSCGLCPPSKSPGLSTLTGVELLPVNLLQNQFDISLEIILLRQNSYIIVDTRALFS